MYSLSRFDLSRDQFFYTKPEEAASRGRDLLLRRDVEKRFSPNMRRKKSRKQQDVAEKIGTFRLPAAVVNMRPTPCLTALSWQQNQLHCFPLSERNFLFADARGCMFSYHTDLSCVVTMPSLHAPKESPLQFTISHDEGTTGDSTIYIIEQIIRPQHEFPFEALVSSESRGNLHPWKAWQCDSSLPLPPYVSEQGYQAPLSPISASAVVDNRFICISVSGIGTYCFDTASRTWSRAGDWMLPFRGMAEYVPELNLWFGAYAGYNLLCAADLFAVVRGQPPERSFVWEDSTRLPEDWFPCVSSTKLVSLGSRRFCVARLFRKMVPSKDDVGTLIPVSMFSVLSGLEVLLPGKGKASGKLAWLSTSPDVSPGLTRV
ncbi:hypothetical protein ACQ4PT_028324 [Festuca glaucescens]